MPRIQNEAELQKSLQFEIADQKLDGKQLNIILKRKREKEKICSLYLAICTFYLRVKWLFIRDSKFLFYCIENFNTLKINEQKKAGKYV